MVSQDFVILEVRTQLDKKKINKIKLKIIIIKNAKQK